MDSAPTASVSKLKKGAGASAPANSHSMNKEDNEKNKAIRGKTAKAVHFDDAAVFGCEPVQFITPPNPSESDLYVRDLVTGALIPITEWRHRYGK